MSTTIINILLASFSLIATLSAFGGKTWKEGSEPLGKRVTKRGYLSLLCLFAVFGLGIFKEVNNNKVLDNKDDRIAALQANVSKLNGQIASYKEVLDIIKDRSESHEQIRMAEAVTVRGRWDAPSFIYPGSIIRFYTFEKTPGQQLTLQYGNTREGFNNIEINLSSIGEGIGYEIPVFGHSGERLQFSLLGNWSGKVFVVSTPRIRDTARSWRDDQLEPGKL